MTVTCAQAFQIVLDHVRPLGIVALPLEDCFGRFAAEDVRADRDLPPADQSAMDGYAVRAADLAGTPVTMPLVGEVAAGSPARPRVRPGTCARILTGGSVPPGADSVITICRITEQLCHPLLAKKLVKDRVHPYLKTSFAYRRRQDLPPAYRLTAAVSAVRRDVLMRDGTIWGRDTRALLVDPETSIDIDTDLDFRVAELLLGRHRT